MDDNNKIKLKFKILLSIIFITIVILYNFYNNYISLSDFKFYKFDFNKNDLLNRIYELKEYILFFIIIIPSCYFLRKSNIEWEKKEINNFINI